MITTLSFVLISLISFFICQRYSRTAPFFSRLNSALYYVFMPCLFFQVFYQSQVDITLHSTYVWIITAFFSVSYIGLYLLAGRWFDTTAQKIMSATLATYGNTAYIGIPLTIALFGQDIGGYLALIVIINLMISYIIPELVLRYVQNEKMSTGIVRILLHPFLLVFLLGVFLNKNAISLPQSIESLLAILSIIATPLAFACVGAAFAGTSLAKLNNKVTFIIVAKSLALPLLSAIMMSLLWSDSRVIALTVILVCMPTGFAALVSSKKHNLLREEAPSAVLLSSAIALFLVPAVFYFYH